MSCKTTAIHAMLKGMVASCVENELVQFNGCQFTVNTAKGELTTLNAAEYIQQAPEHGWNYFQREPKFKRGDICYTNDKGEIVVIEAIKREETEILYVIYNNCRTHDLYLISEKNLTFIK